MSTHITVGYDGSPPSLEAVHWAAMEASSRGVDLRIVTCYQIPVAGDSMHGGFPAEAYAALLTEAERQVAAVKQLVLETHPKLAVSTLASPGPAPSVLIAGVAPGDLIVVGASSHHGAAAFWLGSTPRWVARHAPCPVVVVRGDASRGHPDRVVVGVDGSPAAERAVEWAGDEADRHGVALVVVHGWQYPYDLIAASAAQGRDLTEVDAACVLDRAVEFARERFAADVSGYLVEATPSTALLGAVRDGDLLVVGSSGRGAIAAEFFGSTVNNVLEQAAVPVAVVRGGRDTP